MTSGTYRERLSVPLRWWVQATMLVATFWLAVVVAMPAAAAWAVTAVAMGLVGALLVGYGAARISVDGDSGEAVLRAGRARIATRHLGAAQALDPEAMRRLAGRDADVRAYLLLRPYLKRGVRVSVEDPADSTPYWLLSTRHPDRLVSALDAAGQPAGAPPAEH